MENYFFLDESPIYKGKYVLRINMEKLPFPNGTIGAPAVLPARLLNLSYVDHIRYMRDRLGAEIIGKEKRYMSVYFDNTPAVNQFIKLLNSRASLVIDKIQKPYSYIMEEDGTIIRTDIKIDEDNS